MSTNDNIEDLFRKRFEKEESPVSDRVWENIKKTLPPENKGRRRFPFYFAGVLLVGLLVGSLFLFKQEKTPGSSIIPSENSLKNRDDKTGSERTLKHDDPSGYNQDVSRKNTGTLFDENSSDVWNHDGSLNEDLSEEEKSKRGNERNTSKDPKDLKNADIKNRNFFTPNYEEEKGWGNKNKNKNENTSGKTNGKKKDGMFVAFENNKKKTPGNLKEEKSYSENPGEVKDYPDNEDGDKPFAEEKNTSDKNNIHTSGEKDVTNGEDDSTSKENGNPENKDHPNNPLLELESEGKNNIARSDSTNRSSKPSEKDITPDLTNDENLDVTLAGNTISGKDSSRISPAEEDSAEVKEDKVPKGSLHDENVKNEEKKDKKLIHLSVDLLGSPALTYRSLSGSAEELGNRNEFEKSKFNLGGGIRINAGLSDKISVNGGIGVVSYGENYKFSHEDVRHITTYQYDTIWVQDSTTWNYYVTKDSFTTETHSKTTHSGKNVYRYLEIPFSASYIFSAGKFRLGITGGISANILLSAYTGRMELAAGSTSHQLIEQRSGSNSPFRPVTFGAFINPTIVYHLNGKWAVFAEPGFKFLLSSVYKKEENISLKPYGVNLNVGVRYIIR